MFSVIYKYAIHSSHIIAHCSFQRLEEECDSAKEVKFFAASCAPENVFFFSGFEAELSPVFQVGEFCRFYFELLHTAYISNDILCYQ